MLKTSFFSILLFFCHFSFSSALTYLDDCSKWTGETEQGKDCSSYLLNVNLCYDYVLLLHIFKTTFSKVMCTYKSVKSEKCVELTKPCPWDYTLPLSHRMRYDATGKSNDMFRHPVLTSIQMTWKKDHLWIKRKGPLRRNLCLDLEAVMGLLIGSQVRSMLLH